MSILRYDARRDENEADIVDTLRKCGLSVERIDQPVDLLVGHKGRTFLVEVKTRQGRLTKAQKAFVGRWNGDITIIRSTDDALAFVEQVRGLSATIIPHRGYVT